MKNKTWLPALFVLLFFNCNSVNFPGKKAAKEIKADPSALEDYLKNIKLPPGFKIAVYADGLVNARSMALSPNGTLYVGTRDEGSVYALRDENGNHKVDKTYILATGLNMPNGVAFKDGDLYVAEINRILKFENIESKLTSPPPPLVVYDQYPDKSHHGWKYIAFGPDGKLYVPVGAPCNICEEGNEIFASITRLNPDGTGMEVVQHGIRNTVGFDWHPETKELWFTDNGRDWMGDDLPACELNHATKDGMHFGYPYCHQGDLPDDRFGKKRPCSDFTPPAQKLGPHVAPLGMEFYTGDMFPAKYKNQILIAEHGSWNRSKKIGYRVMMVTLENGQATSYQPFAEGWLDEKEDEPWGRPVDLEILPDGSLLVSDDFADAVYRIYYEG
ncbi:MAG: sorbosone dehydrogenase family protein [Lewinellaceae bacterium]|nr:sorbosone dehydrogenase family protein [Saprospiraceae bacterium]MCB9337365.1 sorbosone dehydrogenase family protein [Lewinellaceae bacterium]